MSEKDTETVTFEELERLLGIQYSTTDEQLSSLSAWYGSVRRKPLSSFSVNDLSRSISQGMFLDYVVPIGITRVAADPIAGDLYDGELIVALMSIPNKYWQQHVDSLQGFKDVLGKSLLSLPKDMRRDAEAFLAKHVCQ